jgi:Na+/H+-dicarboxylate symporter
MKKKAQTPWKIFIAIILAIFFGTWAGEDKGLFGVTYYSVLNIFGTIFLNALTLIVVPLVSSSIITGVARIGNEKSFGRLGGKMFTFYLGTSLMAILIGLFFVNLIGPGVSSTHLVANPPEDNQSLALTTGQNEAQTMVNFLIQIIPPNIVDVFSQGHMLSLIFFSLIFGYAISRIETQPAAVMQGFWQALFQATIRITQIIMIFLPYGVFCLVAKTFATTGLHSLASLVLFFITTLTSLATFMFIGLPILLKLIGRVSPLRHFKAMSPALITAFSTSSSSATLPITIDCVEKRAGVSNRICSLVVPLGTSINMSGSALYECVAAMFVAQAYGIHISFLTQFVVVCLALITSIGVAGIPSASLVAIIIILRVIGLPAEGIGLFIAVDRLLDMCRTTVNVFSDSCCAVLVAQSEGENVLSSDPERLA